jgi:Helix-turn-helix domain
LNALIEAAWKTKCEAPSDKLVLVYLADRANKNSHHARPHLPTIVRETGLGRSTVIFSIQRLEWRGDLTVSRKKGCANSYFVHPKAGARTSPAKRPVQQSDASRPMAELLPVQPLDQHPNHSGTVGGTGSKSPTRKREFWQLQRDEKSLTDRIKTECESCKPDKELIEALKEERRKVRGEMKEKRL